MAKNICVVGGGAAGMCAAIYAARNLARVTIIEKNSCLGKKLSMTGNGRCNLTNLDLKSDYYNPAARERIKDYLATYGAEETINFFKSLGVVVTNEDGYIYPASGQAKTVVDALESEIKRLGITVRYKEQFKGIRRDEESGNLYVVTNEREEIFDSVVIATGSLSGAKSTMSTGDGYYICKSLGMRVTNTHPALVGFKTSDDEVMPKSGVRSRAKVTFTLGSEELTAETGEVQFTSDGISGIPVMQASRVISPLIDDGKPISCLVDFFPDYDDNDFRALKKEMLRLRDERTLSEFLVGFANSNITEIILKRMKMSGNMKMKYISVSMADCIMDNFRSLRLTLKESYGYAASQVTTGGVSIGEIGVNLSYKRDHDIFLAGELLDVDGRCGGYNLQWAWTSGSIAGTAASL